MATRTARNCTVRFQLSAVSFQRVRATESRPRAETCMLPVVVVSARGEERLRSGHPWIYRTDVADARAGAGDIVQVRNARGRALGSALFSDRSQITLRMLSYGDAPADEGLLRARIATAVAFRQTLAIDATAY